MTLKDLNEKLEFQDMKNKIKKMFKGCNADDMSDEEREEEIIKSYNAISMIFEKRYKNVFPANRKENKMGERISREDAEKLNKSLKYFKETKLKDLLNDDDFICDNPEELGLTLMYNVIMNTLELPAGFDYWSLGETKIDNIIFNIGAKLF